MPTRRLHGQPGFLDTAERRRRIRDDPGVEPDDADVEVFTDVQPRSRSWVKR